MTRESAMIEECAFCGANGAVKLTGRNADTPLCRVCRHLVRLKIIDDGEQPTNHDLARIMRSVQEYLPAIFRAIRDEAGVTVADLRRLADGPGIPSDVILNTLLAVKHQEPKASPDLRVAMAQFSYELGQTAREDVGKVKSLWKRMWGTGRWGNR